MVNGIWALGTQIPLLHLVLVTQTMRKGRSFRTFTILWWALTDLQSDWSFLPDILTSKLTWTVLGHVLCLYNNSLTTVLANLLSPNKPKFLRTYWVCWFAESVFLSEYLFWYFSHLLDCSWYFLTSLLICYCSAHKSMMALYPPYCDFFKIYLVYMG